MAKKCSKLVEILPGPTIEWLVGSTKTSTARITRNGRNIAMPKVKQPNKTGGDPRMFKEAGKKWRSMTESQKQPWKEIAKEKEFRSGWHAFNSSFFRSVAVNGIDYTMSHELIYVYSNNREKKAECLINSIKRNQVYQVDAAFYNRTEELMKEYRLEYASPHIQIRLSDFDDINNALSLGYLYRSDDILESQFHLIEKDQYTEKGTYILIKRSRLGQELIQAITAT